MEFIKGFCSFISAILGIYSTAIFIRIVVSWILLARNRGGWNTVSPFEDGQDNVQNGSILDSADMILGKICDPFLGMFRSVKSLRRSIIDLTPLLALVVLNLVRSVLGLFARSSEITVWVILAIIVQGVWESLVAFLLILTIILLVVRFFIGRSQSGEANNVINVIDPILDRPVGRVYKMFFRKGRVDDQKLVLSSIIFYVVVYFLLRWGVGALVKLLLRL